MMIFSTIVRRPSQRPITPQSNRSSRQKPKRLSRRGLPPTATARTSQALAAAIHGPAAASAVACPGPVMIGRGRPLALARASVAGRARARTHAASLEAVALLLPVVGVVVV